MSTQEYSCKKDLELCHICYRQVQVLYLLTDLLPSGLMLLPQITGEVSDRVKLLSCSGYTEHQAQTLLYVTPATA